MPISLMIMSRAFILETPLSPSAAKVEKGRTMADVVDKETAVLRAVADEISSLSPEVVNEAVIQTASNAEGRSVEMKVKKLEALKHQNELIEEERKEAEQAAKELAAKAQEKKAREKTDEAASEQSRAEQTARGRRRDRHRARRALGDRAQQRRARE